MNNKPTDIDIPDFKWPKGEEERGLSDLHNILLDDDDKKKTDWMNFLFVILLLFGVPIVVFGFFIFTIATNNYGLLIIGIALVLVMGSPEYLDRRSHDSGYSFFWMIVLAGLAYLMFFALCLFTPIYVLNTPICLGSTLIINGISAWIYNIFLFASLYNIFDEKVLLKDRKNAYRWFKFPNFDEPEKYPNWKPGYTDYLFLSFNVATSFAPSDTPVLSKWAKILMMLQSLLSLSLVIIVIARGVNILFTTCNVPTVSP
jgi:uncharacterized membrane protein